MVRAPTPVVAVFLAACLSAAVAPAAVVRVPQDAKDLQSAIAIVDAGGTIELAEGTYASPAAGFRIANTGKRFTIRAAAGARVVLDGGGVRPLLDFANGDRSRGGEVVFERLIFARGATAKAGRGPLRVDQAEARFLACRFEANRATGPADAGALRVANGSTVSLVGSVFVGNSAQQRAGALAVLDSRLYVARTRFADNHVDVAGHSRSAPGGAVYLLDSVATIYDSLFENNAAGYVGGALYVFGKSSSTPGLPTAQVLVARSTFAGNVAQPNPCCSAAGPTEGGALHLENQAVLRLQRVFLQGNRAADGGAISGFGGRLELYDSVFRGNLAMTESGTPGTGGAVVLFSADGANPGGAPRRPASLTARNTLFQGRFGPVGATARAGGCVALVGNGARDAPADHRARGDIAASAFVDCDTTAVPSGGAVGGALFGSVAEVRLTDSLVALSDAAGENGQGGGVGVLGDSRLALLRAALAGNSAGFAGGAVAAFGADLSLVSSAFLHNEVSPGQSEQPAASRGAAVFSRVSMAGDPILGRGVTGEVRASAFLEQIGLPWFEVDDDGSVVNALRYEGNAVADGTLGSRIYASAPFHREGLTVEQVNALVVHRSHGPSTDKSTLANVRVPASSRMASLLALPRAGFPGIDVPPQVAYAWAGGSARLDGQSLAGRAGLTEHAPGGATLAVDGVALASAAIGAEECTSGPVLCLRGGRFRAELRWQSPDGESGAGSAVASGFAAGTFAAPTAGGPVGVQVLDSCARNGHFWIVIDGRSARAVRLSVLDTWSGQAREFASPGAAGLGAVRDRATFSACGLAAPPSAAAKLP